jgi:betaine-aldehyde dehydrogenase
MYPLFMYSTRDMHIVKEESFGPVLTVETFPKGDEKAAIRLANDSPFGLGGGVQTDDLIKVKECYLTSGEKSYILFVRDTFVSQSLVVTLSSSDHQAARVARQIRAGTVWTNTYGAYTPRAEWGGMKMSGNGREVSRNSGK